METNELPVNTRISAGILRHSSSGAGGTAHILPAGVHFAELAPDNGEGVSEHEQSDGSGTSDRGGGGGGEKTMTSQELSGVAPMGSMNHSDTGRLGNTASLVNHSILLRSFTRDDKREADKDNTKQPIGYLCSSEDSNKDIHISGIASSRNCTGHTFHQSSANVMPVEGTSWFGGALIMANVCIGMGILSFPKAISDAGGLLNAAIFGAIFLFLIILSLGMTAYCCRFYGCVNYQDMVTTNCGQTVGMLCRICLLLEVMGACIVKLVVFADQIDRSLLNDRRLLQCTLTEVMMLTKGPSYVSFWYLRRTFIMPVVATCTILPMCLLKNFQIFKYSSFLGIMAAVYIAFGVAVTRYATGVESPEPIFPLSSPRNLIGILPLFVFAFHGHIEAPVVFCCLRKNRIFYFMRMVYVYLFVAVLLYTATATFGYLTFGSKVNADFLLSYPVTDWVANTAMILVILKLFTSFPVIFFIMRSVVEEFWRRYLYHRLPIVFQNFDFRRVFQTVVLFGFCCLLASVIKNMTKAIDLIGGISCNFAFTFPGLCFMRLHLNRDQKLFKNRFRAVIGGLFVVLGAFITGTNTTIAVQQYFLEK